MRSFKLFSNRKTGSVLLFLIFIICSCKFNNANQILNNEIILVGDIKNLPVKKVYLTDAYKWETIIDSAVVTNNKFKFLIDSSKYHEPFLASICVVSEGNKREQIFVYNYKRTNAKDTFTNTGFMLSFGKTELPQQAQDSVLCLPCYYCIELKATTND